MRIIFYFFNFFKIFFLFNPGITQVAEMMVSIRRLKNFMLFEEVSTRADRSMVYRQEEQEAKKSKKKNKKSKSQENGKAVEMENGKIDKSPEENLGEVKLEHASAKWLGFVKDDTLHDINVNVKPGELIAIVGQVGSGKSSLLNVILKELPLTAGSVQVKGLSFYFFFVFFTRHKCV